MWLWVFVGIANLISDHVQHKHKHNPIPISMNVIFCSFSTQTQTHWITYIRLYTFIVHLFLMFGRCAVRCACLLGWLLPLLLLLLIGPLRMLRCCCCCCCCRIFQFFSSSSLYASADRSQTERTLLIRTHAQYFCATNKKSNNKLTKIANQQKHSLPISCVSFYVYIYTYLFYFDWPNLIYLKLELLGGGGGCCCCCCCYQLNVWMNT